MIMRVYIPDICIAMTAWPLVFSSQLARYRVIHILASFADYHHSYSSLKWLADNGQIVCAYGHVVDCRRKWKRGLQWLQMKGTSWFLYVYISRHENIAFRRCSHLRGKYNDIVLNNDFKTRAHSQLLSICAISWFMNASTFFNLFENSGR